MTSGLPYAEVIGDPIAHSKSPLIHGFWLEKLGLRYEYRATQVARGDLADHLRQRRTDPLWCGCNVTMPLKKDVVPLLDERSPEVRLIGAANTVVRLGDDKRLVGHNTDLIGVREPLLEWMESERFFTASLIGTGGAAAAAMIALMRRPASLHINNYGRTHDRALAFRRRFDDDPDALHASAGIEELAQARVSGRDPELLINASALGMRGHPPLVVDLAALAPRSIVFDMVYDPLETELLRSARAQGLQTVDGLQMLVAQAAAAFELLFCEEAPREHDEELRALLTS